MKPLTPQKVLCACFQKTTTILLIGCHVRAIIIIFENSHTILSRALHILVWSVILSFVFLSSLYFSRCCLVTSHTHTQTDTHNPTRLSSKFFSFLFFFFFLVIFCCDLVLRHRVKKEFFEKKKKKCFVSFVCDRLVVCRCKKKKKKKK